MKLVCISASNILHQRPENSTSYKICKIMQGAMNGKLDRVEDVIIELKDKTILPCTGCGRCFESHRCIQNDDFNSIYIEIIKADMIIIVSPHYAPIPAKLAALLEKMEQITFLPWVRDNSYKSQVFGKPVGIISHGGGGDWALKSYKRMVNDTIANALDTIQLKTVGFSDEWPTGISLPVKRVKFCDDNIFPIQEYDWDFIAKEIFAYADRMVTMHNQS